MGVVRLGKFDLKAGVRGLSGLFLSRGCPVCDRPSPQVFCTDCQRQIAQSQPAPSQPADASLPVIALGHYSGPLKQAVLAMKYSDRPEVAGPLGTALSQRWSTQQASAKSGATMRESKTAKRVCAVPIPLHPDRQRSRGFNQAELIARAFCRPHRLPLLVDGLVRVQATQPQHLLGLEERTQNLSEAFEPGDSLHRYAAHTVWLIDDIYTTGTTARSAAATLRACGVSVAGIAVIARA